jgi:nuclear cap-binding protein subunit 1
VKIILLTISYAMSSSGTSLEDHPVALLEKTDIIASTPHALETLVDPYPGNDSSASHELRSVISLLQVQLQAEASSKWPLKCIPRPWKYSDSFAQFDTATKHAMPEVAIPSPVVPGNHPRLPEVLLSVYTDQEIRTIPPEDDIASSIIRDAVVDTINILDFNRTITAKSLIDLDCYFTADTFVKRATPYDRLREIDEVSSKWKPEDIVVDAVFSQLFQLPCPEHKLVYYHSVLTEACKIAPAAIAPSLGRAIRFLYKNVDSMDLELRYRLIDWFAHHLSNFGFTWKWTEWIADVKLPMAHPKKSFMIGALEKEVRLSFGQRIRGTLPEPYQELLPETKEQEVPVFKFADDREFLSTISVAENSRALGEPYAPQAREILRLLRMKAPDTDIQEQILAIQDIALEQGVSDPLIPSTDAFVTSLCLLGSKSLSHVLSCIERNKDRLLAIGASSEAARRQIIGSVIDYWLEKPGVGVNIVDKLLNYTILTPMSVMEWVFMDKIERGKILTHAYIYEMVANTIFKVTNRVRQIVSARMQPGLATEQIDMLEATLSKERQQMKQLFTVLEDGLSGIAEGSADAMAESRDQDTEGEALLRGWGHSWLRVFRRKLAVEEAWTQETLATLSQRTTDDVMSTDEHNSASVVA